MGQLQRHISKPTSNVDDSTQSVCFEQAQRPLPPTTASHHISTATLTFQRSGRQAKCQWKTALLHTQHITKQCQLIVCIIFATITLCNWLFIDCLANWCHNRHRSRE